MRTTSGRARRRALGSALTLACAFALVGCGGSDPEPMLTMPPIVGMAVGQAEAQVYDGVHTSLLYYDLSPADRTSANDWVVVSTYPAAGAATPKYRMVHAWVLKRSEYVWFQQHPTMPKVPTGTAVATLLGAGGALAPVKELVQVRYQPGRAPRTAKPSKQTIAFTPDRGVSPDPSTEPAAEFASRRDLRVAPTSGTLAAGTLPRVGGTVRTGQLLVLLATAKPAAPKARFDYRPPDLSKIGNGSGGSGSPSGSSGQPGGLPGGLPGGIKLPSIPCPRQLC